jgi:hypothetical protein
MSERVQLIAEAADACLSWPGARMAERIFGR